MERTDFLKRLGWGIIAIAVAPVVASQIKPKQESGQKWHHYVVYRPTNGDYKVFIDGKRVYDPGIKNGMVDIIHPIYPGQSFDGWIIQP